MRLRFLTSLVLLVTMAATGLVSAGEGQCNASARECAQQIRQMLAGRRYLGIRVVEIKPGLIIKDVLPGSPAAGVLRAGDMLVAVNGRSLSQATASRFKQYLAEAGAGTGKVWLIIQRRGAFRKVEARLEPYPQEYIEKVITAHMSTAHPTTAKVDP